MGNIQSYYPPVLTLNDYFQIRDDMSQHNTIRIPTWYEVKQVLAWGSTYALLHLPYIPIKALKEISKVAYLSFEAIDRLYTSSVITPMKGLVYQHIPTPILEGEVVEVGNGQIPLFDWSRLQTEYDNFPHIRIIGKSGSGKTYTAEQVLKLLGGNQWVITCKKKPHNWVGQKVYGVPFKWDEVEHAFKLTMERMWGNYELIERGLPPLRTNVAIDEWRSIKNNVPSTADNMRELISVARDAEVRLICLATGEQVKTWGLEGESDLGDCFTTIRLKGFAVDHAKKLKLSPEKLQWLYSQERPCMVDDEIACLKQLKELCDKTSTNMLQPSFENTVQTETLMPTVLHTKTDNENEVTDEYKKVIYRLYKSETMSDSDIIKNVMGYTGNRYAEGKALFNTIIEVM